MAYWYEVFDHPDVLRATRLRARRLAALFAVGGGAFLIVAPLVALRFYWGSLAAVAGLLLVTGAALHVAHAIGTLRRQVWCVKLSAQHVVGYSAGQQGTAIAWRAVERVEVEPAGLVVVGRDERGEPQTLRVPASFPAYSQLSHRLVEYAEAYGRPVCVDGRPWQHLDVHEVYPFLSEARRVGGASAV